MDDGKSRQRLSIAIVRKVLSAAAGALVSFSAMCAWEPEKPVELIVPASTDSDMDQKARLMQDIIVKYSLMKQPLSLVYKSGGAGAEGFLTVKQSQGNAHQLLLADNKVFTLPMSTGLPFNWKDTTPVAMLALDQFVLWTNTQSEYKSAKDYIAAAKLAGPGKMKMGGTGARLSDRVLTVALERERGSKFQYVPLKLGAEVAAQLVEKNVDSTVNKPADALAHWRTGELTAQCVFDGARGTIFGMSRGTTRAHIARAALDAIALQCADVLTAMQQDAPVPLTELRVDGGAARNDLLMQRQADLLSVPVVRPRQTETTALGAAYLAGLGCGLWPDKSVISTHWEEEARFEPRLTNEERQEIIERWQSAVRHAIAWAASSGQA